MLICVNDVGVLLQTFMHNIQVCMRYECWFQTTFRYALTLKHICSTRVNLTCLSLYACVCVGRARASIPTGHPFTHALNLTYAVCLSCARSSSQRHSLELLIPAPRCRRAIRMPRVGMDIFRFRFLSTSLFYGDFSCGNNFLPMSVISLLFIH